jgi:hypothetical protein
MTLVNGDGAEVKEFMVQRAERETVCNFVRPRGLMPSYVRGLKANRQVSNAQIQAANGTHVPVGLQYGEPKRGIAWSPS